ncbi:unnamed protein product, partial [Pylaiella littoralis]
MHTRCGKEKKRHESCVRAALCTKQHFPRGGRVDGAFVGTRKAGMKVLVRTRYRARWIDKWGTELYHDCCGQPAWKSTQTKNVTKHTRNIEYSRCFGAITAAHILSCNTSSSVEMFFFFLDPPPPSPAPRPAISLPHRHLLASSLCAHRHNVLTTTTTTTTTIIIRVTRYVTASSRHNHSDLVQPAW